MPRSRPKTGSTRCRHRRQPHQGSTLLVAASLPVGCRLLASHEHGYVPTCPTLCRLVDRRRPVRSCRAPRQRQRQPLRHLRFRGQPARRPLMSAPWSPPHRRSARPRYHDGRQKQRLLEACTSQSGQTRGEGRAEESCQKQARISRETRASARRTPRHRARWRAASPPGAGADQSAPSSKGLEPPRRHQWRRRHPGRRRTWPVLRRPHRWSLPTQAATRNRRQSQASRPSGTSPLQCRRLLSRTAAEVPHPQREAPPRPCHRP